MSGTINYTNNFLNCTPNPCEGTLNQWCVSTAVALAGSPDSDGDGVDDSVDNCTNHANANQTDSNGDGFGNACDADLNGDWVVNPTDLGIFRLAFLGAGPDEDFNGDGVVNPTDLGILRLLFLQPPGPNATGTCP